jgi:hypothetical protein
MFELQGGYDEAFPEDKLRNNIFFERFITPQ